MKFKFKLAALSVMLSANAIADPVYLPPGSNLTYGNSSNNQSIMSSITNPAAAAAQLSKEDSQYRFGILSSLGAGYEFGNVGQLYNTIDSLKNTIIAPPITQAQLLTSFQTACGTFATSCTPAQTTNFVTDVINIINTSAAVTTANTVLAQLQQDGTVSIFGDVHVPLTPFVVTKKGLGGSIVLDANVSAIANMSFIADPLAIQTAEATAIVNGYINNPNVYTPPSNSITNDSTLLVKAAVVGEVGLGYSRPVMRRESGEMTAGVRAKYYQVKLVRDAARLVNSTGAQNTFNASKAYTSGTGIGLDFGTLWTAKRYRVGGWINNVNSPSFNYNAIDPAVLAQYTNPAVKAQLSASDTYTMKPQLELEAATFSESQNWVVNAGLDANAVPDPVGRDFQWATLSAAYATSSWWIPGARIGYRTNLAGSKLSYVTAGLTMFKALSLDVAYGLDKITDNKGNSIPRSAMINLGLQMTF